MNVTVSTGFETPGSQSRQRTGSGGRLSAAGITCQGYAEWTQNKAHGAAEGTPARGRILACPQFIFIPGGISNGK